ncbi:MAG: hypothetical protein VR72_15020 [Clostridiaceae bacterium BRH_c20a]|nr:MAG: hypothetical protein VR72_15020 [Clostridiaceae bacterium BRH_c20a]
MYSVLRGDSLWFISQRLGVPLDQVMILNGLNEKSIIYVDQIIKLPNANSLSAPNSVKDATQIFHKVQNGDTAWLLSIKYGIPMPELLEANGLKENSILFLGQELKIPVHNILVKPTVSAEHGELLDWWTEAQYVWPLGSVATVVDFQTKKSWQVTRSYGAAHADVEPLTAKDAVIMKEVWGGKWSWSVRPVLVLVNGHRIAASASAMPHSIEKIGTENNFSGHSDIHFLNSRQHKDFQVNENHQRAIHEAAGI